jgi:hypothetical protein
VFLGNVLALTFLIFGVMALYAYLVSLGVRPGIGRDNTEHLWDRPDPVDAGRKCLRHPSPEPLVPQREDGKHKDTRLHLRGTHWDDIDPNLLALFGGLHPLRRGYMALQGVAKGGRRTGSGARSPYLWSLFGGGDGLGGATGRRVWWVDSPKRPAGVSGRDRHPGSATREVTELPRTPLGRTSENTSSRHLGE